MSDVSLIKDRFCQFDCPIRSNKTFYNPTRWTTLSDEINEIITNHIETTECGECGEEIDLTFEDVEIYEKVDKLLTSKGLDSLDTLCNKLCPLESFIRRLEEEKLIQNR